MKTEPEPWQSKGSKLALARDAFALWMAQGTGKTWTALKVIAVRWRRHSARRILVVGPKNVVGGWRRQIRQHLNVPAHAYLGKEGIADFEPHPNDGLAFLVINYELLWRYQRTLLGMPWDMVVVDEGHRLRKRTSRQSKAAWRLGRDVRYKLHLTGTPIGKDEIDLFAQFRFIDEDVFGPKWGPFEKRYLRKAKIYKPDGGHWFKVRVKPGAREKIAKKIAPYVFRVDDSVLKLDRAVDEAIVFPLTGRCRTAYDKLERDFMVEFGDFKATTPLAITKLLRLSQLTGGYLGLDDKETLLKLEQDKLAHFEDWLEDWPKNEKLVVFARHTHEVDALAALMKKHKRSFAIRDGRTKKRDMNAWMDFQDKPHPQVFIAQIASGGIGTDLFAARCAVFYSNSFSWIDYDQARKRVYRKGQRRQTLFLHMLAENTIDEDLYDVLDQKYLTTDAILRRIQARRRNTMAKSPKAEKATKADKPKQAPPPRVSPDFGVPRLATALGLTGAEVRVLLRAGEYQEKYKTEAGWDFKDQATVDKVAAELKDLDGKRKKAAAERKAERDATAAKKAEEAKAAESNEDDEEDGEEDDEDDEEDGEEDEKAKPAPKGKKK